MGTSDGRSDSLSPSTRTRVCGEMGAQGSR
jgi:hypothetical protein